MRKGDWVVFRIQNSDPYSNEQAAEVIATFGKERAAKIEADEQTAQSGIQHVVAHIVHSYGG